MDIIRLDFEPRRGGKVFESDGVSTVIQRAFKNVSDKVAGQKAP